MSLCPICQSPFCPNSDVFATLQPATESYTVVSFDPGLPITPADLGLDIDVEAIIDALLAEALADEFEAEVESALAEVEVGNILSNREGQALADYITGLEGLLDESESTAEGYRDQLIAEEQAHAETLAELGDFQDALLDRDQEIAELRAQVFNQARLLALASLGLEVAAKALDDAATERALINVFYGI